MPRIGLTSDLQSFGGLRPRLEVLRCIKPRARAERRQKEFRRCHAGILAAIDGRLVADHSVATSDGFELHITEMYDFDFFHK